jgi:hypothetical protein
MARYSLNLPTNFEVPALASVGGLLVAITLAKGDHALWAIGGMTVLYGIHLAAQCAQRRTNSAFCLSVDSFDDAGSKWPVANSGAAGMDRPLPAQGRRLNRTAATRRDDTGLDLLSD